VSLTKRAYFFFYLISGHPKIIHRDVKAANILLDYNYETEVDPVGDLFSNAMSQEQGNTKC
jgi:serine/threonine protein kinase